MEDVPLAECMDMCIYIYMRHVSAAFCSVLAPMANDEDDSEAWLQELVDYNRQAGNGLVSYIQTWSDRP